VFQGAECPSGLMSALGHKLTFCDARAVSALPPKADMAERVCDVRFVPISDISLFNRSEQYSCMLH
jgi:hypothetical protein